VSTDFRHLLLIRAEAASIRLSERLLDKLCQYFALLVQWNRKVNLTGFDLTAPTPAAVDRLFLEPIAASRLAPHGSRAFLDIGSGGGSPAIPLALALSDVRCVMVESRTRKSIFLVEAARTLQLNAQVLTTRYQDIARDTAHRGRYDALTVRAVRMDPSELSALSSVLTPAGVALLFRSGQDTAPAYEADGLRAEGVHPLPGEGNSQLLVLRKTG
jgi:16S rRNA (guanine527-N7)-methyltransferase